MRWGDMPENQSIKRIAVLGGGLAGLAAAHRLQELAKEHNQNIEVTLFEAGTRLGGLVGTVRIGEYLVDTGADSFLTNKPAAIGLCRRLGIEDRLVATDTKYRGALVLYDGRPVPIPEGFQLLSPTAIWPIITTPLFSAWGKVRMLMEWFVPRRKQTTVTSVAGTEINRAADSTLVDESLSEFVIRRFGHEALNRLVQPLVGGIYTSDPERLSLAATMPRFLEMERDHGSLICASLIQKWGKGNKASSGERSQNGTPIDTSSGARYGLFAGLKGGMQDLVDALRQSVESSCSIKLNSKVDSIKAVETTAAATGVRPNSPQYVLTFADGTQQQISAVIAAVSAVRTAEITEALDSDLCHELRQIEYASSVIVVSGHRLADIQNPLHAFGLVIPHAERRRILAVSFSSRKFPERAPADRVLLRTFVGGALQPELFKETDEQILKIVREELAETLGVRGEPDFMRVVRYEQAMPQYHVGHLNRVAKIEDFSKQHAGFAIAGIGCRGVGVPDAIASAERAAEEIFRGLREIQ
jgi:oxygen-dependent protoporphyrinogen oxidase